MNISRLVIFYRGEFSTPLSKTYQILSFTISDQYQELQVTQQSLNAGSKMFEFRK